MPFTHTLNMISTTPPAMPFRARTCPPSLTASASSSFSAISTWSTRKTCPRLTRPITTPSTRSARCSASSPCPSSTTTAPTAKSPSLSTSSPSRAVRISPASRLSLRIATRCALTFSRMPTMATPGPSASLLIRTCRATRHTTAPSPTLSSFSPTISRENGTTPLSTKSMPRCALPSSASSTAAASTSLGLSAPTVVCRAPLSSAAVAPPTRNVEPSALPHATISLWRRTTRTYPTTSSPPPTTAPNSSRHPGYGGAQSSASALLSRFRRSTFCKSAASSLTTRTRVTRKIHSHFPRPSGGMLFSCGALTAPFATPLSSTARSCCSAVLSLSLPCASASSSRSSLSARTLSGIRRSGGGVAALKSQIQTQTALLGDTFQCARPSSAGASTVTTLASGAPGATLCATNAMLASALTPALRPITRQSSRSLPHCFRSAPPPRFPHITQFALVLRDFTLHFLVTLNCRI
eukprot:m.308453 g.308453  ORF g.308453 m.308453 type:complete len:466 (+) comp21318_c0_seq1:891-2288(+)